LCSDHISITNNSRQDMPAAAESVHQPAPQRCAPCSDLQGHRGSHRCRWRHWRGHCHPIGLCLVTSLLGSTTAAAWLRAAVIIALVAVGLRASRTRGCHWCSSRCCISTIVPAPATATTPSARRLVTTVVLLLLFVVLPTSTILTSCCRRRAHRPWCCTVAAMTLPMSAMSMAFSWVAMELTWSSLLHPLSHCRPGSRLQVSTATAATSTLPTHSPLGADSTPRACPLVVVGCRLGSLGDKAHRCRLSTRGCKGVVDRRSC